MGVGVGFFETLATENGVFAVAMFIWHDSFVACRQTEILKLRVLR